MNSILKRVDIDKIIHSLKTYPLTFLSSVLATAFFCISIYQNENHTYFEMGMASLTGIALLFAVETYSRNLFLRIFAIGILVIYYWVYITVQMKYFDPDQMAGTRYILYNIIIYLLVALSGQKKTDVWTFNKGLFINFIITSLYTLTLFGGLAIAFASIRELFDLRIPNQILGYLFVICNICLHTLLFIGNSKELYFSDYPKALKNFATYILIPLTCIYTLILLAYGLQIILTQNLPKGWVSIMVFSNAILGILSFLLLYPLRQSVSWINKFTNLYFWILLPLIALLAIAIWVRIDQYGLTFSRVLIISLGFWLLGIALYYIISKKDLIVVVPASLAIVLFLTAFGPLNGNILSTWQQKKSLNKNLEKLNVKALSEKELDNLNASISYFQEIDSTVLIKKIPNELQKSANLAFFKKHFKIPNSKKPQSNYEFFSWDHPVIEVKDSDYLLPQITASHEIENSDLGKIVFSNKENKFYIDFPKERILLNLEHIVSQESNPIVEVSGQEYKLRLILDHINLEDGKVKYYQGNLFVKKL